MFLYLFYLFIIVIIIQLVYYLGVFSKFCFAKPAVKNSKNPPISVIVCAKNEQENIKKYIPILAQQEYPDFELVLIDDASSDETLAVFEDFEKQYDNIRLVKVQNNEAFWGNKKYALTLGIKAAKHEHLLFTDANCFPSSNDWIASMAAHFDSDKKIVLGYAGRTKANNSFFNKLVRFETVVTAVQYFLWAKIGKPYMGIGRNLAYKRDVFFNANGFVEHIKMHTGDDNLFINQAATAENTTIAYLPESFTYSESKKTFEEWLKQKRIHATTIPYYKLIDRIQLGVFFGSQLLFLLLAIVLLASQFKLIVMGFIVFRYTFTWIIFGLGAKKLKEKDVIFYYPILEIWLTFIQITIFVANIFSKPTHWR